VIRDGAGGKLYARVGHVVGSAEDRPTPDGGYRAEVTEGSTWLRSVQDHPGRVLASVIMVDSAGSLILQIAARRLAVVRVRPAAAHAPTTGDLGCRVDLQIRDYIGQPLDL
jgi:hypothetical protein